MTLSTETVKLSTALYDAVNLLLLCPITWSLTTYLTVQSNKRVSVDAHTINMSKVSQSSLLKHCPPYTTITHPTIPYLALSYLNLTFRVGNCPVFDLSVFSLVS